jgi:hypothetical protein
MRHRFMTAAAIGALALGSAAAAPTQDSAAKGGPKAGSRAAQALIGVGAVSTGGEGLGEVSEIVRDEEGAPAHVVIDTGDGTGTAPRNDAGSMAAPERASSPSGTSGGPVPAGPADTGRDMASADGSETEAAVERMTGLQADADAAPAARDAYDESWSASLEDWSEMVETRAEVLGGAAAEELTDAWTAVEAEWETLSAEADQTWSRARIAFEDAFETFEESWAKHAPENAG